MQIPEFNKCPVCGVIVAANAEFCELCGTILIENTLNLDKIIPEQNLESPMTSSESESPMTSSESKVSLQTETPQEDMEILLDKEEGVSRTALMMINSSAVETLAHNAPEELIKFADSSDQRQFTYYSKLAEYRHSNNRNRENTIRLALGSIFGIVLMAFVYAGLTKDNTLPTQLINTLVGGAGGLGVSSFLQKKKED